MINKNFLYAVVGASSNEEKYGYKVFKDLLDAGYKVLPIHPSEKEILGEEVYASLSDVKEKIDVVIFVTQPKVTEKVLEEVKILGIKNVWLQPGAQSDAAIQFGKKITLNVSMMHALGFREQNKKPKKKFLKTF